MTRPSERRGERRPAGVLLAGLLIAGLIAGLLVQTGCTRSEGDGDSAKGGRAGPEEKSPAESKGFKESAAGGAAAKSGAGADEAFLPPDKFLGTWNREGEPKIFESAGLYGYIDGGAEVYLELGFDQLTVQRYISDAAEILVEVYRMTDPAAALGIYLMQCGRENPDKTLGARNTKNPFQLFFVKGAAFGTVTNAEGSPEGMKALTPFGRYVAARLPAGDAGDLFAALPAAGRIAGSERVIRGPFTFQTVYTLGAGDILELKGRSGRPAVTAAAADYEGKGGETLTRIAAVYPDAGTARAVFEKVPSRLDPNISVLSVNDTRLVFEDFAGKFGAVAVKNAEILVTVGLTKNNIEKIPRPPATPLSGSQ